MPVGATAKFEQLIERDYIIHLAALLERGHENHGSNS